ALHLAALPLTVVIGLLGGLGGVIFNKSLLVALDWSHRIDALPRWMLPGIVGAAIGLAAWWLPGVAGGGRSLGEPLLNGSFQAGGLMVFLLLAANLLAASMSYGSGAPGGIFAPMLLQGALMGTAAARIAAAASPSTASQVQAFAVLGRVAFFVGSVR